jgi:hypothetical protein
VNGLDFLWFVFFSAEQRLDLFLIVMSGNLVMMIDVQRYTASLPLGEQTPKKLTITLQLESL